MLVVNVDELGQGDDGQLESGREDEEVRHVRNEQSGQPVDPASQEGYEASQDLVGEVIMDEVRVEGVHQDLHSQGLGVEIIENQEVKSQRINQAYGADYFHRFKHPSHKFELTKKMIFILRCLKSSIVTIRPLHWSNLNTLELHSRQRLISTR